MNSAQDPDRGNRKLVVFGILGVTVLAMASMAIGKYSVPPSAILRVLFAGLTGGQPDVDPIQQTVIWNVRLPRVIAGLLIGAALAAAGATYQGLFRNPLVSPDILGVSAGASLGAVLAIFLKMPVPVIQLMSFFGGLLAVAAVYGVGAAVRGRDPVLTLVLAGVAIGAIVGAGISLVKILADPYDQLPAITYWLLGSLTAVTRADVGSILPAMVIGLLPLVALRWRMNVMTLGDEEAQTLGVDTRLMRLALIFGATLITAASVSIAGIVGWVGLVIPHVARLLVGPDFRRLLPAALLLGGGYMLVVDTLARSVALAEIPLGILTAVVGAPFFLWLLASGKRGWS
ncbi:iron ABC transporter permease [Rhizobium wenxiniae]|uniref:Iron complex transport system permease protein n=1 Tax=Rhizobium wenxiniae TaxID=1737357 RepID=A0A7X0D0G6_9HYPH|nr:iron ABC transporter permease [Rhizobium wenxiniae]MBB6163003.1 iron complex transport system permease protein [Rhizobium wenxiniae]GGF94070.1 iron ABC transporter permease [Rhizobium wenxiniae]